MQIRSLKSNLRNAIRRRSKIIEADTGGPNNAKYRVPFFGPAQLTPPPPGSGHTKNWCRSISSAAIGDDADKRKHLSLERSFPPIKTLSLGRIRNVYAHVRIAHENTTFRFAGRNQT